LRIAVDTKSKQIISFRVTKGTVHDTKKFVPMIKEISKHNEITKVHMQIKHICCTTNFNLLDKLHIEPVISLSERMLMVKQENANQEMNRYI
jgi:Transposase DDE domain